MTQPSGLEFNGGQLYSSAWAVNDFLGGAPDDGQVVNIASGGFVRP
jgi:hypothetical protein